VDVQVGSVACFKTEGGRIGYLTVHGTPDPNQLTPSMTVEATVWERQCLAPSSGTGGEKISVGGQSS
jgi:hypothetical protein